jgi:hypothetical protein
MQYNFFYIESCSESRLNPGTLCNTRCYSAILLRETDVVRYEVLTATGMKKAIFWDVAPCSLVDTDRHFITLKMEAVSSSETSINIYQTAQCYIPQDGHLEVRLTFITHVTNFETKIMLLFQRVPYIGSLRVK